MAAEFPGWVSAPEAVERYGIAYVLLRNLVANGVFTRGRFSLAEKRPPIYLRIDELDAWKRGGIDAVRELRAAPQKPEPAHSPDLGGEG